MDFTIKYKDLNINICGFFFFLINYCSNHRFHKLFYTSVIISINPNIFSLSKVIIYSLFTSHFKFKKKDLLGGAEGGSICYFANLYFLDRFLKFSVLPACVWVSVVYSGTNTVWSLCFFSRSLFSDKLSDYSSVADRSGNSRQTLAWVSSPPWQWISPRKSHFEQVSSLTDRSEGSVTDI